MYQIFPAAALVGELYAALLLYAAGSKNILAHGMLELCLSEEERQIAMEERWDLGRLIDAFQMRQRVPQGAQNLERLCHQLVGALIHEVLETKMEWLRQTEPAHHFNILHPLFTRRLPEEQLQHLIELMFRDVLDDLYLHIEHFISQSIPNPTWKIWYFSPYGNDFIIQEGEDYRIVHWDRTHEQSGWTPEHYEYNQFNSGQREAAEVNEALEAQRTSLDAMIERQHRLFADEMRLGRAANAGPLKLCTRAEPGTQVIMLTLQGSEHQLPSNFRHAINAIKEKTRR